mgnify:CR=1 FL=1
MKRTIIALAAIALVAAPLAAFAQPQLQAPPTGTPPGFADINDFVNLLNTIIQWLFYLLLIVAVLMLIWAAFTYLTAGGDEEKIGKAKNMILGAVIALVIAFVASGIPTLVGSFLGQP